jgi:hypothetical protein
MRRSRGPILALLLAPLLAGCEPSAKPDWATVEAMDHAPSDFTLELTVYAPPPVGDNARTLPTSRPARYVMEADGVLRVAVGGGVNEKTFPDQTRQLTAAEVDRLWQDLRDSGLLDAEHPSRVSSAAGIGPPGHDTVYVLSYSAAGRRGTLVVRPSESGARRLVDRLTRLAWIQRSP